MRKLQVLGAVILLEFIVLGQFFATASLDPIKSASAQASGGCTNLPVLKTTVQVPVNGNYVLWLRGKTTINEKPSAIFTRFDNETMCNNFKVTEPSDTTQWVSAQDGLLRKNLTAGAHTLNIAVEGGSAEVDRVLVTGNAECTPIGEGTNCLDQDVKISIEGISGGDKIGDSLMAAVKVTGAMLQSPRVEFYFNDSATAYATRVTEPYCLASENSICSSLSTSFLSNGGHKLKIVIRADNLEPVTHLIPFTKTTSSTPVTITPPTSTATSSSPITTTSVVTAPTKSNTVVVGATTKPTTKTVTGTTVATVSPSQPLATGDKVTYKVNGTEYATSTITDSSTDPSTTLDLSDQEKGTSNITADIERTNGTVESYTTKAKIDNSTSATTKSWFGRGGFKLITTLFGGIAGLAATYYLIRYIKQRREYAFAHNMNNYEYVQPDTNALAYSLPPVTVMLFAVGAIFSALTGAETARVGMIADLTKALLPSEYSLVAENGSSIVHMKYTTPRIIDDTNMVPTEPDPIIIDDTNIDPTPSGSTDGQLVLSAPPFASTSLWNSQISAAQQSKWFDLPLLHYNSVMNESRKWFLSNGQLRVWHGTATDPVWTVTMPQFGNDNQTFNRNWPPSTFTIHAPQNIQEGTDGDHILAIIDHVTGEYFENWSQVVIDSSKHTIVGPQGAGWARGNAVTGTGFGVPLSQGGNSAGVRAANFSWIAGAITGYDIQQILDGKKTDFGHAFVVALGYDTLSKWGVTTPATAPDNGVHEGPIKMGTRIGIPSGVAIPAQIDPNDKIGVAYFNTLQRYGAFVGDFAGGQWPIVYVDGNSVKSGSAYELALNNAWIWWNQEGVIDPAKTANQFCVPLLRLMEDN